MKTKFFALAAGMMAATALASVPAQADVKIGLIGGVSGPIAAMAPAMIDAAQLAVQQVNEQGGIGDGEKLVGVVGDSACNPQNGTDAATKAVNIEGVIGTAAAAAYVQDIGYDTIRSHEEELVRYAKESLNSLDGVTLLGPRSCFCV